MLNRWLWRVFVGLCFGLPMAFLAVAVAAADTPLQSSGNNDCQECHTIVTQHWQESAHATAVSDPVFQEAWHAQGENSDCMACHTTGYNAARGTWEADGVTCEVCHTITYGEHPDAIMPTDISSRLCGQCHLETHTEWESSSHGQEDLPCIRCHNAHTTQIRKSDTQELCQTCHNREVHFFSETVHAQEGLICTDCHIQVDESNMGEGHGASTHTFVVNIETCESCHENDLHAPATIAMSVAQADSSESFPQPPRAEVYAEPSPVSPVGFAVIAALIGMGSGMILAPWLETWFRRFRTR